MPRTRAASHLGRHLTTPGGRRGDAGQTTIMWFVADHGARGRIATDGRPEPRMTKAHQEIAEEIDALLAPVGEEWWQYKKNHPEIEMYAEDGAHASPAGSDLAASCIWETIRADLEKK